MNIGIAGNGKIVQEMLEAVKQIEDVNIKAICSRPQSEAKARTLATKYGFYQVYTDYATMLQDSDIDFIYVAVPNNLHYAYTKQALEAGKNVICEKPFTVTADEAQNLSELAQAKKLFLFEAITLIYSPNYTYFKQNLTKIGQLRYVHANYAQYSSRYDKYLNHEVTPVFNPAQAGGSLYDLNIYNLHYIVGLFGKPQSITYKANLGFNGIDTSGTALLYYPDFIAVCSAAKDSESVSGITFQGEKGYMQLVGAPNTSKLIEVHLNNQETTLVNKERYDHRMIDEFIAFAKIYKAKDYETCYAKLDHSLKVMQVLEQARLNSDLKFNI